MSKSEATELLNTGRIKEWNRYRDEHPDWAPDLSNVRIVVDLSGANLERANICGTDFREATFYPSRYPSYAAATVRVNLEGATYSITTVFPRDVEPAETPARLVSTYDERSVFISYAWADGKLVKAFDTYFRAEGLITHLDRRDFFAGARIPDEIMRVMKACRNVLIFRSKESADRAWPQYEQELAEDLEMDAKQKRLLPPRIIYIVLDDVGLPNVTQANRIAVFARGRRFEDVAREILRHLGFPPGEPDDEDLSGWIGRIL